MRRFPTTLPIVSLRIFACPTYVSLHRGSISLPNLQHANHARTRGKEKICRSGQSIRGTDEISSPEMIRWLAPLYHSFKECFCASKRLTNRYRILLVTVT